ncbi:MAG: hypothetical protein GY861_01200 [bacterium]|nr:hypothetical protein [bacterium]
MPKYYRIQPTGLDIKNHTSVTSADPDGKNNNGLHVFLSAWQVFNTEGHIDGYGLEVVEIESPCDWDNEDVEGVAIDPRKSTITRRWTLEEFEECFDWDDDNQIKVAHDQIKEHEMKREITIKLQKGSTWWHGVYVDGLCVGEGNYAQCKLFKLELEEDESKADLVYNDEMSRED